MSKDELFTYLCEFLKTCTRYESATSDGKHVEVCWWSESEGIVHPVEGYFLLDASGVADFSKIGTAFQDNIVWCGEHNFIGEQASQLRHIGIKK